MVISEEMTKMRSYDEQMARLNRIKKTFSWEEMQPLHKNENCENLRELKSTRDKQKRIAAELELENDNTKCMIVKKLVVLSDAISWRQAMRDHRQVNANSISLISYEKIIKVKDQEVRKKIEDMLAAALMRDVHPFALTRLKRVGMTEAIVDDVIEFCQTGFVRIRPADKISLKAVENLLVRDIISKYHPKDTHEKKILMEVLSKLDNSKRYGWMKGGA